MHVDEEAKVEALTTERIRLIQIAYENMDEEVQGGFVEQATDIKARNGDKVHAGQQLLVLKNFKLDSEIKKQSIELDAALQRLTKDEAWNKQPGPKEEGDSWNSTL